MSGLAILTLPTYLFDRCCPALLQLLQHSSLDRAGNDSAAFNQRDAACAPLSPQRCSAILFLGGSGDGWPHTTAFACHRAHHQDHSAIRRKVCGEPSGAAAPSSPSHPSCFIWAQGAAESLSGRITRRRRGGGSSSCSTSVRSKRAANTFCTARDDIHRGASRFMCHMHFDRGRSDVVRVCSRKYFVLQMKIFNHGRHHIFKNLTPAVFVSMGKRQQYLQVQMIGLKTCSWYGMSCSVDTEDTTVDWCRC